MSRQATRHIKSIVGGNIRVARDAAGLTQRQLGALVNDMDSINVSRWERGQVMPSPGSLVALAEALGQPVAWFYTDHEPEREAAA